MATRDTYVNPIADGDQLNDGYFNGIADRIDNGSKVLAVRQTTSATTSTSAVTVDTVTLTNHGANTAYRLIISMTGATIVGNAYVTLRFTDGANNTDLEFRVDDGNGTFTSYTMFDIYPASSTSFAVFGITLRDSNAPDNSSNHGNVTTLASSGTWVNQDTFSIRHRVGTSGTLTMNSYSFQRVWGAN